MLLKTDVWQNNNASQTHCFASVCACSQSVPIPNFERINKKTNSIMTPTSKLMIAHTCSSVTWCGGIVIAMIHLHMLLMRFVLLGLFFISWWLSCVLRSFQTQQQTSFREECVDCCFCMIQIRLSKVLVWHAYTETTDWKQRGKSSLIW